MSERTIDVYETLLGSMNTAVLTPVPVLLRSCRGGQDYRENAASASNLTLLGVTNEVAPDSAGGECVFYNLHVSVSYTAPALLFVDALIDGTFGLPLRHDDVQGTNAGKPGMRYYRPHSSYVGQFVNADLSNTDLGLDRARSLVRLWQQQALSTFSWIGQPAVRSEIITVPLVVDVVTNRNNPPTSIERLESRQSPRGRRIAALFTAAEFGAGYFAVDGVEVEYEVVPKTQRPGNVSTGYLGDGNPAYPSGS